MGVCVDACTTPAATLRPANPLTTSRVQRLSVPPRVLITMKTSPLRDAKVEVLAIQGGNWVKWLPKAEQYIRMVKLGPLLKSNNRPQHMKEGEFEIAVSQAKGYLQMLTDPSWHKDIESRTPADFWTWIQQRCQQLNPNECRMAKSKIQRWEWNPEVDSEANAKDFLKKVQLDILLDAQMRVPVKYMYQLQTLSTRMKVPGAFDANEKNAAGDCTAKALFDEIHQADE
ncbi:hypothetical protein DFJ74DRAFT_744724 [Hyaloraphidium curvatum]|nr:hypothetical protein DFJ74DRAFT_744724 [Hyaloraphidium curvatum]